MLNVEASQRTASTNPPRRQTPSTSSTACQSSDVTVPRCVFILVEHSFIKHNGPLARACHLIGQGFDSLIRSVIHHLRFVNMLSDSMSIWRPSRQTARPIKAPEIAEPASFFQVRKNNG